MRIPPVTRAHRWVWGAGRLSAAALLILTLAACERPEIVTGSGTVSSSAGTVDVECIGRNKARITGSSAAAGYTARVIVAGPSGQASLIFESPNANDFRVAVHCVDQEPRVHEYVVEDTTLAH